MSNDTRNPCDEESREVAEHHLAQERRPIESKKGSDTAEGKGRNEPERKRQTQRDRSQPVPDGLIRERIEMSANSPGCPPKQPFNSASQPGKKPKKQQSLDPAVFTEIRTHAVVTPPELVWEIRDCAGQSNNVRADRRKTSIEGLRDCFVPNILPRCASCFCLA